MKNGDHFNGKQFFNPAGSAPPTLLDLWKLLQTPQAPWPNSIPVEQVLPPTAPPPGGLVVTGIGHASFLIQTNGIAILTDPVFCDRASPVSFAGPRRVRPPGIRLDDLPHIDLILLSHNHYDHCDKAALRAIASRFDPVVVTPLGNGHLLRSWGAREVVELDWWEWTDAVGFRIHLTPARHFSARTPFDRNKALWGGFLIEMESMNVYFAGDSGYGSHFKSIGDRFSPVDLAFLPIGSYDPRWFMEPVHMNPEEAVQAHRDVGTRRSIAMHHGVFQLTPEPIDEPVERLSDALASAGLTEQDFQVVWPGQTVRF